MKVKALLSAFWPKKDTVSLSEKSALGPCGSHRHRPGDGDQFEPFINNLLPRRRYPNALRFLEEERRREDSPSQTEIAFSRDDLHAVLQELDIFMDISEDDLGRICELSLAKVRKKHLGRVPCGGHDDVTGDQRGIRYPAG